MIDNVFTVIKKRFDLVDAPLFFLVIGTVFGLLFVFITPPVAGLDEEQHFYRAYQVSDLNFKADRVTAPNVYGEMGQGYGGSLPTSVFSVINKIRNSINEKDLSYRYEEVGKRIQVPLNPNERVNVRFDNTAIYSPVAYTPQAIGIGVGKIFNASPVILSYLGRLATLIFWLVIMYMAIRIAPIAKWVFVVLALNPVSLFLAASLSADVLAIGVTALLVASILKLRTYKEKLPAVKVVALFAVMAVLALQKNAYMPLLLLILLAPSRVISIWLKSLLLVGSLALGLSWNVTILPIAPQIYQYFSIDGHISSHDQVVFILTHPIGFLKILLWNIFGLQSLILNPGIAGLAGDTVLPFWTTLLWFVVLIMAATLQEKQNQFKDIVTKNTRIVLGGIALLVFGAVIMSLYVGWNAVGSMEIIGVQARYLIPIGFLLIPLLIGLRKYIEFKNIDSIMFVKVTLMIILTASVITVAVRFTYGIR